MSILNILEYIEYTQLYIEVYSASLIWKKLHKAKKKKSGCKTVRFPGSIFVKNIFAIYMNLEKKKKVHEFKGKAFQNFLQL